MYSRDDEYEKIIVPIKQIEYKTLYASSLLLLS